MKSPKFFLDSKEIVILNIFIPHVDLVVCLDANFSIISYAPTSSYIFSMIYNLFPNNVISFFFLGSKEIVIFNIFIPCDSYLESYHYL